MIAFIDDHREVCGVEPICTGLPAAPSTYHTDFTHVAFAVDAFARRWMSRTAQAGFVLDTLEQALHGRHPLRGSDGGGYDNAEASGC